MDGSFYAWQVVRDGEAFQGRIATLPISALPPGDVLIKVGYSSLNYKDALSATGNPGVTRKYPHIPGIDAAGTVAESAAAPFKPGDPVIVTGYDLGMDTDGGYAEYCRVPAGWVVPLPVGLSLRETMILGTAGFTAALGIRHMLHNGLTPEKGPVLVTGAAGGVGSVAVSILAKLGFQVTAASDLAQADYLREIGAAEVISWETLNTESPRAMLKEQWAGAYDTVGGKTLENVIKSIRYLGVIANCGMVGGGTISTSVFPFILRGIKLLGTDSVQCPMDLRLKVWEKLAGDWKPDRLERLVRTITLDGLGDAIQILLKGKGTGRTLVVPKTGIEA
ncbi:MAG: YhdH/YhfP family quinone oxidoreductase [Deltaproteobacteria bacterium]|nr:YhdH/YhfP family quinone oxidoreductase [Deltaproteobacteria bacterium]